jgi:hypothetical protein
MSFNKLRKSWRSAFVRDLGLAVSNLPRFGELLTGDRRDNPQRSELSLESYENTGEVLGAIGEATIPRFFPLRRKPYTRGIVASEGMVKPFPGEMWLYVNGVATSSAVLKANGKELARIFQRPIHLVHNPTDGLLLDLAECVLGRTFNWNTLLTQYVHDVVTRSLCGYSKVVLIGHSQGGIVVADVANALVQSLKDKSLLANLEIYTFASAADEMNAHKQLSEQFGRLVPYYEHFSNGHDFVARIGAIGCRDNIAGQHFVSPDRTGHLLNAHYLPAFEQGEYCQKKSRLFGYTGGKTPEFSEMPVLKSVA